MCASYCSRQNPAVKGSRSENISRRPASIMNELTHKTPSGRCPQESSGPTVCPKAGPTLLNDVMLRLTESSMGSPIHIIAMDAVKIRMKNAAKNAKIVCPTSSRKVIPPMRTGITARGWRMWRSSLEKIFHDVNILTHLIPPLVEPAQPPTAMTKRRSSHVEGFHAIRSVEVSPVVDCSDTVWNSAVRTESSTSALPEK